MVNWHKMPNIGRNLKNAKYWLKLKETVKTFAPEILHKQGNQLKQGALIDLIFVTKHYKM